MEAAAGHNATAMAVAAGVPAKQQANSAAEVQGMGEGALDVGGTAATASNSSKRRNGPAGKHASTLPRRRRASRLLGMRKSQKAGTREE